MATPAYLTSHSGPSVSRRAAWRAHASAGGTLAEFNWQPFITLKGTGTARVTLVSTRWADLSALPAVVLRMYVAAITSGVVLQLESAPTQAGPWSAVTGRAGVGLGVQVVGTEPFGSDPIQRYLRWTLYSPAGAWGITFRVGIANAVEQDQAPTAELLRIARPQDCEGFAEMLP